MPTSARSPAGSGSSATSRAAARASCCAPDAFDGDAIFKVPFPKVKRSDFPEGRGIFVQAGRAVTVQMPLVEGSTLEVPQTAVQR